MQKVKKIDPLSLAKTIALIYGLFGLVFGGIITLLSVFGNLLYTGKNILSALLVGLAIIIFIPLLQGVIGFIIGWLAGLAFNLTAKWTGGLLVEIAEEAAPVPEPKKETAT